MEKEPIIQFQNFGFQYNAQAEPTLFDINLTIHKGGKGTHCRSLGLRKIHHCPLHQRTDPCLLSGKNGRKTYRGRQGCRGIGTV